MYTVAWFASRTDEIMSPMPEAPPVEVARSALLILASIVYRTACSCSCQREEVEAD